MSAPRRLPASIRVLLADNEVMRKVIKYLLKGDPEINIVGEAFTFAETIKLTKELQPEVVVMDLHMRDGDYVTPSIVKLYLAGSRLLATSIQTDDMAKALAYSFGAVTLLDKMHLATELISNIKRYSIDKAFAVRRQS
jgi:chemotaxis response regulator CheB